MILPVIYFIIGLILLIKGGDWFVDGATGIAHRFHVPELLIGATVVSIGTTLPEVMVSATSAISGHGEIAYGNAIGSIICNVSLIAAITIAIRPSKVHPNSLKLPVFFFFLAAIFYAGTAYVTGHFSRITGIILLIMFGSYIGISVYQIRKMPSAMTSATTEGQEDTPLIKEILFLVVGAILIAIGANLLVDNGTIIAREKAWRTGICYRPHICGTGNFPSGTGNCHHLPYKGTRCPFPWKCDRC